MYQHQRQSVQFFAVLLARGVGGALLLDSMGVAKTASAEAFLAYYSEEKIRSGGGSDPGSGNTSSASGGAPHQQIHNEVEKVPDVDGIIEVTMDDLPMLLDYQIPEAGQVGESQWLSRDQIQTALKHGWIAYVEHCSYDTFRERINLNDKQKHRKKKIEDGIRQGLKAALVFLMGEDRSDNPMAQSSDSAAGSGGGEAPAAAGGSVVVEGVPVVEVQESDNDMEVEESVLHEPKDSGNAMEVEQGSNENSAAQPDMPSNPTDSDPSSSMEVEEGLSENDAAQANKSSDSGGVNALWTKSGCSGAPAFLVLCPSTLLWHWHDDLLRSVGLKAVVIENAADIQVFLTLLESGPVVAVLGMSLLTKQSRRTLGRLWEVVFDICIIDELHKLKGGGEWYQQARDLQARFRIGLSGTPFNNSMAELYLLMQFTFRTLLEENRPDDHLLKELLELGSLRRVLKDVAPEIPEPRHWVLEVAMAPLARALIREQWQRLTCEPQEAGLALGVINRMDRMSQSVWCYLRANYSSREFVFARELDVAKTKLVAAKARKSSGSNSAHAVEQLEKKVEQLEKKVANSNDHLQSTPDVNGIVAAVESLSHGHDNSVLLPTIDKEPIVQAVSSAGTHPRANSAHRFDATTSSAAALMQSIDPKLLLMEEILSAAGLRGVIIFSESRAEIEVVHAYLMLRGYTGGIEVIAGGQSFKGRQAKATAFRGGVLLALKSCAAEGLTILPGTVVVFADRHYNPQVDTQAWHRSRRIGQSVEVAIIHLEADSGHPVRPPDKIRRQIADAKEKLADEVLNDKSKKSQEKETAMLRYRLTEDVCFTRKTLQKRQEEVVVRAGEEVFTKERITGKELEVKSTSEGWLVGGWQSIEKLELVEEEARIPLKAVTINYKPLPKMLAKAIRQKLYLPSKSAQEGVVANAAAKAQAQPAVAPEAKAAAAPAPKPKMKPGAKNIAGNKKAAKKKAAKKPKPAAKKVAGVPKPVRKASKTKAVRPQASDNHNAQQSGGNVGHGEPDKDVNMNEKDEEEDRADDEQNGDASAQDHDMEHREGSHEAAAWDSDSEVVTTHGRVAGNKVGVAAFATGSRVASSEDRRLSQNEESTQKRPTASFTSREPLPSSNSYGCVIGGHSEDRKTDTDSSVPATTTVTRSDHPNNGDSISAAGKSAPEERTLAVEISCSGSSLATVVSEREAGFGKPLEEQERGETENEEERKANDTQNKTAANATHASGTNTTTNTNKAPGVSLTNSIDGDTIGRNRTINSLLTDDSERFPADVSFASFQGFPSDLIQNMMGSTNTMINSLHSSPQSVNLMPRVSMNGLSNPQDSQNNRSPQTLLIPAAGRSVSGNGSTNKSPGLVPPAGVRVSSGTSPGSRSLSPGGSPRQHNQNGNQNPNASHNANSPANQAVLSPRQIVSPIVSSRGIAVHQAVSATLASSLLILSTAKLPVLEHPASQRFYQSPSHSAKIFTKAVDNGEESFRPDGKRANAATRKHGGTVEKSIDAVEKSVEEASKLNPEDIGDKDDAKDGATATLEEENHNVDAGEEPKDDQPKKLLTKKKKTRSVLAATHDMIKCQTNAHPHPSKTEIQSDVFLLSARSGGYAGDVENAGIKVAVFGTKGTGSAGSSVPNSSGANSVKGDTAERNTKNTNNITNNMITPRCDDSLPRYPQIDLSNADHNTEGSDKRWNFSMDKNARKKLGTVFTRVNMSSVDLRKSLGVVEKPKALVVQTARVAAPEKSNLDSSADAVKANDSVYSVGVVDGNVGDPNQIGEYGDDGENQEKQNGEENRNADQDPEAMRTSSLVLNSESKNGADEEAVTELHQKANRRGPRNNSNSRTTFSPRSCSTSQSSSNTGPNGSTPRDSDSLGAYSPQRLAKIQEQHRLKQLNESSHDLPEQEVIGAWNQYLRRIRYVYTKSATKNAHGSLGKKPKGVTGGSNKNLNANGGNGKNYATGETETTGGNKTGSPAKNGTTGNRKKNIRGSGKKGGINASAFVVRGHFTGTKSAGNLAGTNSGAKTLRPTAGIPKTSSINASSNITTTAAKPTKTTSLTSPNKSASVCPGQKNNEKPASIIAATASMAADSAIACMNATSGPNGDIGGFMEKIQSDSMNSTASKKKLRSDAPLHDRPRGQIWLVSTIAREINIDTNAHFKENQVERLSITMGFCIRMKSNSKPGTKSPIAPVAVHPDHPSPPDNQDPSSPDLVHCKKTRPGRQTEYRFCIGERRSEDLSPSRRVNLYGNGGGYSVFGFMQKSAAAVNRNEGDSSYLGNDSAFLGIDKLGAKISGMIGGEELGGQNDAKVEEDGKVNEKNRENLKQRLSVSFGKNSGNAQSPRSGLKATDEKDEPSQQSHQQSQWHQVRTNPANLRNRVDEAVASALKVQQDGLAHCPPDLNIPMMDVDLSKALGARNHAGPPKADTPTKQSSKQDARAVPTDLLDSPGRESNRERSIKSNDGVNGGRGRQGRGLLFDVQKINSDILPPLLRQGTLDEAMRRAQGQRGGENTGGTTSAASLNIIMNSNLVTPRLPSNGNSTWDGIKVNASKRLTLPGMAIEMNVNQISPPPSFSRDNVSIQIGGNFSPSDTCINKPASEYISRQENGVLKSLDEEADNFEASIFGGGLPKPDLSAGIEGAALEITKVNLNQQNVEGDALTVILN